MNLYPTLRTMAFNGSEEAQEALNELNELDHLRRWRDESIRVLNDWDECYDLLPESARDLGDYKPKAVRKYIELLQAQVSSLNAVADHDRTGQDHFNDAVRLAEENDRLRFALKQIRGINDSQILKWNTVERIVSESLES